MASAATEVSHCGHPAAFCSASTNLNDTGPLKLPFFHSFSSSSNPASNSRASTTPFRLFPLHLFRELDCNNSSPGGVKSTPARACLELAQPICRDSTRLGNGSRKRLRRKTKRSERKRREPQKEKH